MPVQTLKADARVDAAIKQLTTTTTYERAKEDFIASKVDPTSMFSGVQKAWAQFCLFCGFSSKEVKDAKATDKQERQCIKAFTSAQTELVKAMAKASPVFAGDSEALGLAPGIVHLNAKDTNEAVRSRRDLNLKIDAFYDAMRARITQIAPTDVAAQTGLLQAGVRNLEYAVERHNDANRKDASLFIALDERVSEGKGWNGIVYNKVMKSAVKSHVADLDPAHLTQESFDSHVKGRVLTLNPNATKADIQAAALDLRAKIIAKHGEEAFAAEIDRLMAVKPAIAVAFVEKSATANLDKQMAKLEETAATGVQIAVQDAEAGVQKATKAVDAAKKAVADAEGTDKVKEAGIKLGAAQMALQTANEQLAAAKATAAKHFAKPEAAKPETALDKQINALEKTLAEQQERVHACDGDVQKAQVAVTKATQLHNRERVRAELPESYTSLEQINDAVAELEANQAPRQQNARLALINLKKAKLQLAEANSKLEATRAEIAKLVATKAPESIASDLAEADHERLEEAAKKQAEAAKKSEAASVKASALAEANKARAAYLQFFLTATASEFLAGPSKAEPKVVGSKADGILASLVGDDEDLFSSVTNIPGKILFGQGSSIELVENELTAPTAQIGAPTAKKDAAELLAQAKADMQARNAKVEASLANAEAAVAKAAQPADAFDLEALYANEEARKLDELVNQFAVEAEPVATAAELPSLRFELPASLEDLEERYAQEAAEAAAIAQLVKDSNARAVNNIMRMFK